MHHLLAWIAAACCLSALAAASREVAAQEWNDERSRALVERATSRRARQLADTGLADYAATARGYLTFLAQIGEGFTEPPKVVKADELALEVYWRAPDLSKQRIVGRRDTLLLPTDINYHRDHLGIVQNNFPSIIRLGEGDEVRDVPHPLSNAGLDEYDFAIQDSISMRLPDRTIDVAIVRVRPRDDSQPRVIGALFIDRATAEVVRMAFNFTRAAFVDRQLEDLAIVLESALVGGRFWLPRRQEIEIRRTGVWLDFPVRGIIRARWEICCYKVNQGLPAELFSGPEIVQAPRSIVSGHEWHGSILDSLPPDVRAVSDEDVRRVQEDARELVRAQALSRARRATLSAKRISDFARVNRVEGLALGAGMARSFGAGVSLVASARYGLEDRAVKARFSLSLRRPDGSGARLFAERGHRDAGDVTEVSLVRNSIAAQEFGSDYTEPYAAKAIGIGVDAGMRAGLLWSLDGAYEEQARLSVHAQPARGAYSGVIPAWSLRSARLTIAVERPTSLSLFGTELRVRGEVRGAIFEGDDTVITRDRPYAGRVSLDAEIQRPFGRNRLVLRSTAGGAAAVPAVPPQDLVYLGGPVSGPGYEFHEFAGQTGASQRIEWRMPVPFVSLSLGRFGRTSGRATLAPFLHSVYVNRQSSFKSPRQGWYPAAGVGALIFFDVIRLDVARGLRGGRWTFSVDASRDLWRIL